MGHHNPNQEMPYFIKPSINMSSEEKHIAYEKVKNDVTALLGVEEDTIIKMAMINSVIKRHLTYAYWVGFYMVKNGRLSVGPFQGTEGCLHIDFGKGVCGAVAATKQTKIVADVTILEEGVTHIACDPHSRSEIVVPVFGKAGELIAVLDIDSSKKASFDEVDQGYLEELMKVFSKKV